MKYTNTAYDIIRQKLTAVFVVFGVLCCFLFASSERGQAASYMALPQVTHISHKTTHEGIVIVKHGKTEREFHLPVREKDKIKILSNLSFFENAPKLHVFYAGIATVSGLSAAAVPRPAYYNFLFRYTPF